MEPFTDAAWVGQINRGASDPVSIAIHAHARAHKLTRAKSKRHLQVSALAVLEAGVQGGEAVAGTQRRCFLALHQRHAVRPAAWCMAQPSTLIAPTEHSARKHAHCTAAHTQETLTSTD